MLWAVHRIPVTPEQVAIGDDGYTDPRAGAWQEPYPYRVREGNGTIVTLRALDTTPGIETMYQRRALQHSAKRYAANGILRSDMSREDVDGEWDWATQGEVVHQGNTRFLLAGHDRVPSFAWNVDESALQDLSVQRTEDSEYGAVQMALERSAPSDWTPATLPALTDGSDGATADLRASLLVSHPIDGGRLLATYVRRKLRDRRVAIKTLPQLHTVWDLKRGDVVTVTLAQADLAAARCTVENLIIDRDLSVMLEFAVTPVDAYADTIDLPDESDRPPTLLPPLVPVRPSDVATIHDVAWETVERDTAAVIPSRTLALSLSAGTQADRLLMFLVYNGPSHSALRLGYWLTVPPEGVDGAAFGHSFRDLDWTGNDDGTFDAPTDISDAPTDLYLADAVRLASVPVPYTLTVTPYLGAVRVSEPIVRPIAGGAFGRLQDLANMDTLPDTTGQVAVYDAGSRDVQLLAADQDGGHRHAFCERRGFRWAVVGQGRGLSLCPCGILRARSSAISGFAGLATWPSSRTYGSLTPP